MPFDMDQYKVNFPLFGLRANITSAHDEYNRHTLTYADIRNGKSLWSFELSSFSGTYVCLHNGLDTWPIITM